MITDFVVFLISCYITFAFFFNTGCQNDDIRNENSPFLDITSSPDKLSPTDFLKLKLAFERVDPYVEVEGGRLKLKINSGEIVNISDKLFEMVISTMDKSNELLDNESFFLHEKTLIPSDMSFSKTQRLRSGYPEDDGGYQDPTQTETYWWGRVETLELDQQGAYDYYHHYEQSGKVQAILAGIVSSFASWQVGVGVTIGMNYISYQECETLYQAAQGGGIIIETWHIVGWSPSTYVRDKNGNSIITLPGDMD